MNQKSARLWSILLCLALLVGMFPAFTAAAFAAEAPAALTATADAANIKKYGNVELSVSCDGIKAAGYAFGDVLTVEFLGKSLDIPFCRDYSDVDSGSPAIFARDEDTQVLAAINMGDFATTYGIAVKTTNDDGSFVWNYADGVEGPVTFKISLKEAGGYYDEYVMHQLSYTTERSDYPNLTDAQFANFRVVSTTGMGQNILYRTASPVDPEKGRSVYADAAIRSAGVTVVMNLVNDETSLKAFKGYDDSYYSTARHIALSMDMDFSTDAFRSKLAEGLRFFAANPGVYAVHCLEGKDRAGYVSALLECFMGASCDEVVSDYMTTYYNYYGVTKDDPRYDTIANGNIIKTLQKAFGVSDLKSADLAAEAEKYFKAIGLSDAELAALKTNLSASRPASALDLPFSDVADGAWYSASVEYVYENGLMVGTSSSTFSPDAPFSRSQLAKVLRRMGYDAAPSGSSNVLTRDEAAFMLWNCAKYLGADVSVGEDTNILSYNDVFSVNRTYMSAMQWAVGSGVLVGYSDGTLAPKGQLTRAQAAAILRRFDLVLDSSLPLGFWTEDAPARKELVSYIEAITDTGSEDYIPEEDRIAVFDLDGTLFCETDPNYFDYTLLVYRVLEDPDYKGKASDFEREVANKIVEQNKTGKSFSGLEVDHGKAVASAFAGMTVAQFNDYIQEFKQQTMPSYTGMLRGEGFYKPMVQVVEYLQDNGFTVYIVSGTDRLIVRGIIDNGPLDIPNRQIIGSDETIVSSNQGDKDGLSYVFAEGDELILGGDFLIKNLKMNKVSVIMQEIGQQPVLSFGNSTGDSSMAEYVTSSNVYKSLAFMLCCDDTERENGSQSKADKMFALCEEFDWIPVSMKNDWKTIYGDGVKYTGK